MDLIIIKQKTTIINKFEQVLHRNNGNSIALRYEDNYDEDLKLSKWNKITWLEYYTQSLCFAKSLIRVNFELKETVCIFSFNVLLNLSIPCAPEMLVICLIFFPSNNLINSGLLNDPS